jgi:poly(hydroxyalkanoate) depolymerase family esterase
MAHRAHITSLAAVLILVAAAIAPRPAAASLIKRSFSSTNGSLTYQVYVPSGYKAGTAVPLIVALHGCTESADDFRQLTRFDELADAKNAIVVFPDKSSYADSTSCWNWYKTSHMQRGSGEPALIAGVTAEVRDAYTIDPHRIYAAGLSAGGAMASVMSATYPDVFAAAGIGSGCEYAAGASCAGYRGIDPESAGKQAFQAMGSQKRVVPAIIFQGDADKTVPEINAEQLVQQWQATDDWADDGARNASIPAAPMDSKNGTAAGGRAYSVKRYSDGHDNELIQFWVVHGMPHAWSGGCGCAAYADPAGPDESKEMYDFFMSHPAP